ncbi:hypothetical protein GN244_ATG17446 [Phytophthora infestans]|uniref:Uncharacterized protein n=1 Tax=Phytophthora infestans TaxID=4787 RepID=A0A833S1N0_PHYIN|nr:hypothetical protein GN244_ATG17446 [Phytophthora infestans]
METGDTPRWHRKWLAMLGILGWLFLCRYRVMGYLLSKAVTFQLLKSRSRNSKPAPVTVRVERVSLQPLCFFNVELSGSGSTCWRVILTKVEVQSHVKEFFESFGLVKICVLAIDEIIGDVDKIDDEVLRDAFLPKKTKAENADTRPKMNPICYLRFVDLKVQSIRLRINCMGTTTKLLCQGLYVGITDVFVQHDMLQLKVQTKSMIVQSSSQSEGEAVNNESDGRDGLRMEIPDTSAVFDLNLRNQRFLGCKMTGSQEQTTNLVVATAFMERVLTARNDFFRKEKIVVGDTKSSHSGDSSRVATPSEVELDCFSLSITIVNEVESGGFVPIQFCADVRKLKCIKQIKDVAEDEVSDTPGVRVQVHALFQNARVHNLASNKKMASVCSIEVRANQTARHRGVLAGAFDKVEIFLSHRSEKIFRSLIAAQGRVEKLQIEARRMLEPNLIASARKDRIHWNVEIEVTSWMMSFKAFAKDGGTDDLTAYGMATSVQTPLAPVLGENGSSFIKRSVVIQHTSVDVTPNGNNPHSAVFGGAELSLSTSLNPPEKTKTIGMSVKFEFVSINGLLSDNSGKASRFPAIYLHDVRVDRREKVSTDVSEVDLDIHMENADVKWHYRQHQTFLLEWAATKNIIDQLDLLLSSSSKKTWTPTDQVVPKILSTNVYSKDTAIDVIDIPGVALLTTFCLVETKVNHRSTQLSVTTAVNSTNASVRWGESPSRINLTNVTFQNRSSLGRQRYLTKVPTQSDIRCASLEAHLRPQSRMLLLFLRLDQLVSGPSKTDIEKRSSVQGISFVCGKLTIELQSKDEIASVEFTTLGVKMTRCTPREITETMTRVVQCLRKEELAGRAFTQVAHQVMVLEGAASASAITAAIPLKNLVELQHTELHFAITDVEWSRLLNWENDAVVPRTTSFDLSMLTERIQLAMERKLFENLLHLMPILQEAFDTKETETSASSQAVAEQPSFRLRFVGNLDIAFQNAELTCPYGDKEQIGSKVTRVLLGEVAFNLRQFQVIGFKCSPLRVMLEDADFIERSDTRIRSGDDSLQLLFVPQVSVNTFVHWHHGIQHSGQLQFALSLEIALGHTHSYDQPTHVPIVDEALVSLNWDCVVPWLIYMITDDNGEYPVEKPTKETSNDAKHVQCVGVQWDLSVNSIQFAWWDTATQDIGMLVVANEFLTHGLLRMDSSEFDDRASEWKLWEATVYLHLFRGYLLHVEDDFVAGEKSIPEILPFGAELASNFSLETVGTSYRNSYTPDDDEDWEALDEEVTHMFAPSSANIFEKMHDEFVPIDYEFGISTRPKPGRQDTTVRLSLLHVPSASAALSPPKSPRSAKNWTQNIKSKLSRLNRRSASMDNLFLKDGSCPIQVDAMRLLWTLQTRDSVFYMVSTTIDSLRLLWDARRNAGKENVDRNAAEPSSLSPSKRAKRSSFRPPSVVSDANASDAIVRSSRFVSRRGSTRDTLLDLLQQGKLGMAQEDRESSSRSIDEETESTRESLGEDPSDYGAPSTAIAMKAYTVDIHDVQINVREENTRSNVLLASKHIHFEIGTDASDTNTIANVTFDNVTAHVAPIDVDITAGVLWYSHSNTGSGSALLKQIMEECSLTSSYTHTQSTGATSTEVDLSFLQLSTDRHQFYQLMNVIRHVLLAPPSVARRPKRTFTPRTYSTESPRLETSDIAVFTPPTTTNTLAASTSAKKLHVLLEEELRNREIRTRGTSSRIKATALKAISSKVVGMQWKLRLSPEITGADHEFVGIRITGFTGCHTYFTNHCTKLTLNLQWLEINNLHPGPSSAAFEDSTAVLKAKLLVDKRLESSTTGNQKGMLVVRAESGPIVRVHGQKLRVLEVLEVSMFPEVSNMIVIQLAADFYELIYKFFFENISPTPQNSEQVFLGRKSTFGPVLPTVSGSAPSLGPKGGSSPFMKSRVSQTSPSPQSSLLPLRKSNSANSMLAESTNTGGPNSPNSVFSTEEIPDDSDSTATDDCELFYVKYVRVGNVRLRINCNGFFVNLSHFDLDLPPYLCQSKLCTSKKLLQKFESHLKWYITKESASSGLSQFKNKILKWTPSSSSADGKKDKSKKQEEDTAAANAQVLFGPYSGTST